MNPKISRISIQVRFKDLDSVGHVNNAVHLTYFEMGRLDYFNRFIQKLDPANAGFVIAHSEVDYKKPIYLHSKVEVETEISKIGNTSFTFTHRILDSEQPESLFATGKTVGVLLGPDGNKQLLPDNFKNLV